MIKVAVVILNWNGKNFLEKFLPSVIEHSKIEGVKIFIADNGSKDDSINYLHNNFSDVQIISFKKNHGFALGYAKALRLINAEYYVLLNSDVEVTPGWISEIIHIMDSDKTIGACMPKIKAFENKWKFEYAGASGGFIDKYGYPFCRGRILNRIEKDTGQYDNIQEIFWASGASMFLRSSAYFEAGELDGDFFAHMEEIYLCWRLQKVGFKIFCVPTSIVYHVGGGTLPNNTPRKIYLNYRNNLFLLYKNLPHRKRYSIIAIRFLFDYLSAFIYLISFKFGFFISVCKAHHAFVRSLPNLKAKRQKLKKTQKIEFVNHIFPTSIVLNFFLKNKKCYSQIKT